VRAFQAGTVEIRDTNRVRAITTGCLARIGPIRESSLGLGQEKGPLTIYIQGGIGLIVALFMKALPLGSVTDEVSSSGISRGCLLTWFGGV
jgi:hypothetical protein